MGILVGRSTGVVVQGITGNQAQQHVGGMLEYGTKILAGVSRRQEKIKVQGVPVYGSVAEAMAAHSLEVSLVMVPPRSVREAVEEGLVAGLKTFVIITEGVPAFDMIRLRREAQRFGARLVGPNTMGIITPGETKIGIMPPQLYSAGSVGIVSRTGSLTHEIASMLVTAGLGQSTCVDIGGDAIVGCGMEEMCSLFFADPTTGVIVILGEIGGSAEEDLALRVVRRNVEKPMFAFIAGRHVPHDIPMGHAGAIVLGEIGSAESKRRALEGAGVKVARYPSELVRWVRKAIG